jgi:hypothetical protein
MATVTHAQLVDLAEGRLPAQAADALRQQSAADPALRAELAAVEELISLMRSDTSVDAPAHVIARAVRLMRKPQPGTEPGLLQRITAALRSDSGALPLAIGMRAGHVTVRRLSFTAEPWTVDLQVMPRAGVWQLRGQLFGPDLVGSVILSGVGEPATAPIDELGEFLLAPEQAGVYTLTVQLGAHAIVLEPLELES